MKIFAIASMIALKLDAQTFERVTDQPFNPVLSSPHRVDLLTTDQETTKDVEGRRLQSATSCTGPDTITLSLVDFANGSKNYNDATVTKQIVATDNRGTLSCDSLGVATMQIFVTYWPAKVSTQSV